MISKYISYIIIVPIKIYQKVISPLLGNNCRFTPSCSNYMVGSIEEWGIFRGSFLGIKRILRCHPWGSMGDDPVPKNNKNVNKTKKK